MVDPKSNIEQLPHLLVPRLRNFPSKKPIDRMVLTTELVQTSINRGGFLEGLGSLDGLLPRMYEHHHLMTQFDQLRNLLEGHSIKVPAGLYGPWFSFHVNEMLLQWDRSE